MAELRHRDLNALRRLLPNLLAFGSIDELQSAPPSALKEVCTTLLYAHVYTVYAY